MRVPAGACLAACLAAGCIPSTDAGYVELRIFPVITAPLYLNAVRLEPLKDGRTILRHPTGKTRLQLERGGQFALLCEFEVRKNRIVTVTVAVLDRRARCEVQR
jgi:hypothetical protein